MIPAAGAENGTGATVTKGWICAGKNGNGTSALRFIQYPVNILWLKTGPLHPLDTGGKIRTYHMLRELKKRHRVTYLALRPESVSESVLAAATEYCHTAKWIPWRETAKCSPAFFAELGLNLLASPLPYVIQKYRSAGMQTAIERLDREEWFDVIICDFLSPAVNLMPVRDRLRARTLLFQHNVESLIWQRMRDTADGFPRRYYFGVQWKRMLRFEGRAAECFDGVAGVSDEDCRLMRELFGLKNVLGSVPTGVDSDFFQDAGAVPDPGSIVFLGSMDWMPNIDAVTYFADSIFPQIRQSAPGATFTIVGRNPVEKVRALEKEGAAIHVTGTVADVRPYVASAAVVVVPLRVGGGTRIKIFEAMAAGAPVVSTAIGAEGLPVRHGEEILFADDPVGFAECVSRLLQQPELREKIGAAGRELVRREFGWEPATKVFENYCHKLLTASE